MKLSTRLGLIGGLAALGVDMAEQAGAALQQVRSIASATTESSQARPGQQQCGAQYRVDFQPGRGIQPRGGRGLRPRCHAGATDGNLAPVGSAFSGVTFIGKRRRAGLLIKMDCVQIRNNIQQGG